MNKETNKESNFGKDKYGRAFEFAENSKLTLMNREMRRKMKKEKKHAV